jgi:hypothetical protein
MDARLAGYKRYNVRYRTLESSLSIGVVKQVSAKARFMIIRRKEHGYA